MSKQQIAGLTKDAVEVANLILEHIGNGDVIHLHSHIDADGLSAAGIMGKALLRAGGKFRLRLERWMDEKVADRIAQENAAVTIFTDMGSGYLDLLGERLANRDVVILDHHQPVRSKNPPEITGFHVNPYGTGINGSSEISGSGMT